MGAAVLTGGPRVFAAGADITDMAEQSSVDQLTRDQTGRWARISGFTKPLLAAVNGYALGGGCELALMCDLIVAGDSARFGQPEINLGIIPGAGGTQRWPRTAGKYVAMEVNLLGTQIPAQRAYQLGIVNRVVPAEVTVEIRGAAGRARRPPGPDRRPPGQGIGEPRAGNPAFRGTGPGAQELLLPVRHRRPERGHGGVHPEAQAGVQRTVAAMAQSETQEVLTYRVEDGVGWIRLNRPRQRNALDARLRAALGQAVNRAPATRRPGFW